MRIEVEAIAFGYYVYLTGGSPAEFSFVVSQLKNLIPRACRRYQPVEHRWFIHTRAARRLDVWLALMRSQVGATILDHRTEEVQTVKATTTHAQSAKA